MATSILLQYKDMTDGETGPRVPNGRYKSFTASSEIQLVMHDRFDKHQALSSNRLVTISISQRVNSSALTTIMSRLEIFPPEDDGSPTSTLSMCSELRLESLSIHLLLIQGRRPRV